MFKTRNNTPYLTQQSGRPLAHQAPQALGLDERGLGWHGFRRFRKTWLRGRRVQEDINNFWMGHKPKTMSELYSRLDEELELRLA